MTTSSAAGPAEGPDRTAEFERHRPRMFSLAYRMLGSAEEAQDVVQDAYLRFAGTEPGSVEHLGGWLAKVVTNLCLNRLTSARARRERYAGPWLPEPVLTSDGALGPLESAEQRESVSAALLLLLERLTPTERAVYVLREAFAYGYREIASVLGLGEANCRQLYRRATARIGEPGARFAPSERVRRELAEAFVGAAREGDLAALEKLLAADVVWWGDGGGKVSAARRPVEGREKVLRFLVGVAERYLVGAELSVAEVNGGPGLVVTVGGRLFAVVTFEVRGGLVVAAQTVLNPDKLEFMGAQLAAAREG
ncbi:RNA polymerase sigma-70 factor [Streptomyces sp. NPDC046939]|uniref:RNA polymerase sigma-70 factor n=1 Tax=Streptomyces sp. NPDC046939 TaxID=3155376 RepID=UPI0033F5060C